MSPSGRLGGHTGEPDPSISASRHRSPCSAITASPNRRAIRGASPSLHVISTSTSRCSPVQARFGRSVRHCECIDGAVTVAVGRRRQSRSTTAMPTTFPLRSPSSNGTGCLRRSSSRRGSSTRRRSGGTVSPPSSSDPECRWKRSATPAVHSVCTTSTPTRANPRPPTSGCTTSSTSTWHGVTLTRSTPLSTR